MNGLTFIHASSLQTGALAVFHIHGAETALQRTVDAAVRSRQGRQLYPLGLEDGELVYGWFLNSGVPVDEIMLAKPKPGFRILSSHGGRQVVRDIIAYLGILGASQRDDNPADVDGTVAMDVSRTLDDPLMDPLLASARTQLQIKAILDYRRRQADGQKPPFPDRILRTHTVALAGPPNAGKSSVFNALCGYDRAFVHHQAGATLDAVEEAVEIGGYIVKFIDLPGFRQTVDSLESRAHDRAVARLVTVDGVVIVHDGSKPWNDADEAASIRLRTLLTESQNPSLWVGIAVNKTDLPAALLGEPWRRHVHPHFVVRVTALPEGDVRQVMTPALVSFLSNSNAPVNGNGKNST